MSGTEGGGDAEGGGAPAPGGLRRVTVVGASAAGLAAAEGLRRGGFEGELTLVGAEPHLPYDRPPLSKQLLSGAWEEPERLRLRPADALDKLRLDLRLNTRATALDTDRRTVTVTVTGGGEGEGGGDEGEDGADGAGTHTEEIGYDALVIATGARARPLPGTDGVAGVHLLRDLPDALALRAVLRERARLLIVGGGFIGAEAAAVARDAGCEVTLVTDTATPMGDAVGDVLGGMLAEVHQERGVRIVTGATVDGVESEGGRATGVRLADGRTLAADAVLVGIGAVPNTEWLKGSSVPTGNGVECDATLRAADGVWAAGDVASWPHADTGARVRVEHRTNASEQGIAVARNILAGEDAQPLRTVPYVWSDQYDLKVQVWGLPRGADEFAVVRGGLGERRCAALYGRDGRVCAAVGVNMVRALRGLRRHVAEHAPWDETLAALAEQAEQEAAAPPTPSAPAPSP